MKPIALVTLKTRLRNSASGRIGSARATLDERRTATSSSDAADDQRDASAGEPQAYVVPPRLVYEHDRREAAGEQRRAEVVDRVPHVVGARVEHDRDHAERERADRQVDVEDPAPRQVVDEEAAEQRPDHRRDAEDGAEEALVAAAVARRDDVADDGDRDHDQPAAAEPLQRAERDQLAPCSGERRTAPSRRGRSRSPSAARACGRRGRRACRRAARRPSRRAGTR